MPHMGISPVRVKVPEVLISKLVSLKESWRFKAWLKFVRARRQMIGKILIPKQ
jgi:hypothetical protein